MKESRPWLGTPAPETAWQKKRSRKSVRCFGLQVAALAITACLLAACSESSDQLEGSPLAVHDGAWNGDDAALRGILVQEDGCLLVQSDEQTAGGRRVLLAFAEDGLEWDDGEAAVGIYGHQFRVGEPIRIGGSSWFGPDPDSRTVPLTWIHPPSAQCRYDMIWGVTPPQPDRP